MRIILVHNPRAGDHRYDRDTLVSLIRGSGHQPEYFSSRDNDWKAACDERPRLVVAAGGDGTVAKVARHLAGRPIAIAILPLGTANNISRSLGLARTPLPRLMAGWTRARQQPFDIGVACGPWGMFRFLESVGAGLLADFIALGRPDGRRTGPIATPPRSLTRGEGARLGLYVDGRDLSGELLLVEAVNARAIGPRLRLAPGADPADGFLDLVLLRACAGGRPRTPPSGGAAIAPRAAPIVRRARHVQMIWNGMRLHLDDRIWPDDWASPAHQGAVIDLTVERHALRFLVPGE